MMPIVLFATKGGNTEKIAQVIASELTCQALNIGQPSEVSAVDLNDFDLLFVGTGIYWGNPNADMERYLEKINLKTPKTFALFITWGGAGKTDQASLTKLTRFLENKGHHVLKNQFTCFGGRRFALLKSGHPNAQDISAAKQWARSIIDASQK